MAVLKTQKLQIAMNSFTPKDYPQNLKNGYVDVVASSHVNAIYTQQWPGQRWKEKSWLEQAVYRREYCSDPRSWKKLRGVWTVLCGWKFDPKGQITSISIITYKSNT